jgi:hypothetical protein
MISRDETDLATRLLAAKASCWAVASGGTRRAFLAAGGVLAGLGDLDAYFDWLEREQRALVERLFEVGVRTLIIVGRLPADRGEAYQAHARRIVPATLYCEERLALYDRLGLRVSVAGDVARLGQALDDDQLAPRCQALRERTRSGGGGDLVYLYRGAWVDGAAEAAFGYELGRKLDRPPTVEDLVPAYYGVTLPPLAVYVGSGRPQVTQLRPPFISGSEACYWSVNCPFRLTREDWERLAEDYLSSRQTRSARDYPADAAGRTAVQEAVAKMDHLVVGMGRRQFGFWYPESMNVDG